MILHDRAHQIYHLFQVISRDRGELGMMRSPTREGMLPIGKGQNRDAAELRLCV